jgi:PEP-CTERM motif
MRKLFGAVLALVLVSGIASATLVTVVVPDPSPLPYIFYGNGDASVTYSGVMFNQFLALGNANLFDVGPLFSGDPAVLSSQEASVGVENILITFPNPTGFFSIDYGTFNGSAVTFALSNGQTFTQGSTGSGYLTPDFFTFSGTAFTSVEITSPDFVMNINNITYNSGTTVPEPDTLVMLGSGIIGLAGVLRRKINL